MNILQFQQALHNHTQDPSNDGVFQLDCTWRLSVWFFEVGKKTPGISEDKRHLPLVPTVQHFPKTTLAAPKLPNVTIYGCFRK